MKTLTLLPAIDITDGQAVRLVRGSLNEKTNYGTPVDVARQFVEVFEGANTANQQRFVHLVDLDAAFRRGENRATIAEVVQVLNQAGVNVELSGGIRDDDSLEWAIGLGVTRVNVGTSAIEDPIWTSKVVQSYGDKLAIGLDVKGETLAARGWVKEGGNLWDVLQKLLLDGVERFVVTDVNKDGTLQGVNTDLLQNIFERVTENGEQADKKVRLTASGGVSSLEDIKVVQNLMGNTNGVVDSVIFGKALYSGQFTLGEALELVQNGTESCDV